MNICPEDVLRIFTNVKNIPDGATVSKRNGDRTYTLCHTVKVYGAEGVKKQPLEIKGYFVLDPEGEAGLITQVSDDTYFHWHIVAEDLVSLFQRVWYRSEHE